jgi:hypothetical protein
VPQSKDLTNLVQEFARIVAREIVAIQRERQSEMIDQNSSPLGVRRHCSAVRRRLACSKPGAAILGRKHLLSSAALDEELKGLAPKSGLSSQTKSTIAEELADSLRSIGQKS